LAAGILWSDGVTVAPGGYSLLSWHDTLGAILAIAVATHMAIRAKRLRRRDLAGRRQFLTATGFTAAWGISGSALIAANRRPITPTLTTPIVSPAAAPQLSELLSGSVRAKASPHTTEMPKWTIALRANPGRPEPSRGIAPVPASPRVERTRPSAAESNESRSVRRDRPFDQGRDSRPDLGGRGADDHGGGPRSLDQASDFDEAVARATGVGIANAARVPVAKRHGGNGRQLCDAAVSLERVVPGPEERPRA
jgi:hypothetical protein